METKLHSGAKIIIRRRIQDFMFELVMLLPDGDHVEEMCLVMNLDDLKDFATNVYKVASGNI